MRRYRLTESRLRGLVDEAVKNVLNEGESGGWIVDSSEAEEAYEFAVERMGKETVDSAIIRALSSDALADCLAYIFRMYDFTEWKSRFEDDEEEDI